MIINGVVDSSNIQLSFSKKYPIKHVSAKSFKIYDKQSTYNSPVEPIKVFKPLNDLLIIKAIIIQNEIDSYKCYPKQ